MVAPPFRPQAVVFDLDGLLVDSEDAWARATRRVVEELGGVWDDAVHELLVGSGPVEAARMLAEYLGNRHDPAVLGPRMLAAARDEFAGGMHSRPGALDLVKTLHERVPLAVATNSTRDLADRALESTGLAGWFVTLVTADDVAAHKPAPEPYTRACAGCGASPDQCVALEDSPAGTLAARAAGLWVVGCPSRVGLSLPAADAVVGSLTEIDADLLVPHPRR